MSRSKSLWTLSAALLLTVLVLLAPGAGATSKFKTLHKFKGSAGGAFPFASPIFDTAGNLYGTTYQGGADRRGSVFKLTQSAGGSWTESVLYSFKGGNDGGGPFAGLVFDTAGNLYGTTFRGGGSGCSGKTGCGTVFKLMPNPDGSWTESVLYSFKGGKDGGHPYAGLIFDQTGNLYGTAVTGGNHGGGVVFKLTANPDGSWTESVLHAFCSLSNCGDGAYPYAGLIFDGAGNLYGTTMSGDAVGSGVVFKLTANPDGSWTESVLYSFSGGQDGGFPFAGVIFDGAGNLYGTAQSGGTLGWGVVFQLTPKADGSWAEAVPHSFTKGGDGAGPESALVLDGAGNLYGTTVSGGTDGWGVVFKLTPNGGGWSEKVLHQFTDGKDGGVPYAGMVSDAAGNLYGSTSGGPGTFGSVFEITP